MAMNKALGIAFKLCQMLLYSVGSVRDTININKKTNGVYRRIDLGLCKACLEKDPQSPMFHNFFSHCPVYTRKQSFLYIYMLGIKHFHRFFRSCMKGCDFRNL